MCKHGILNGPAGTTPRRRHGLALEYARRLQGSEQIRMDVARLKNSPYLKAKTVQDTTVERGGGLLFFAPHFFRSRTLGS